MPKSRGGGRASPAASALPRPGRTATLSSPQTPPPQPAGALFGPREGYFRLAPGPGTSGGGAPPGLLDGPPDPALDRLARVVCGAAPGSGGADLPGGRRSADLPRRSRGSPDRWPRPARRRSASRSASTPSRPGRRSRGRGRPARTRACASCRPSPSSAWWPTPACRCSRPVAAPLAPCARSTACPAAGRRASSPSCTIWPASPATTLSRRLAPALAWATTRCR